MVMAQSLCKDLKAQAPDGSIHMLAPAWSAAIVDRMPEVDGLIATDFQHGKLSLGARWRLGRELRKQSFTDAIVLPNSLKSALIPAIAQIPVRTGFLGEQRWGFLNDVRKLNKQALPMTVQRFLALGRNANTPPVPQQEIPIPELSSSQKQATETAEKLNLSLDAKILALCPGAEFGASKQWPASHFAELSDHYASLGWSVWALGSANDRETCESIRQLAQHPINNIAGQTSLPQVVDLLSLADLVVSNDSGLMHIAAGLNRPLVAIYGSTDPGHTPPLSANHTIARLELDCSPCFKRQCPLGHHNCMQQLDAGRVTQLAEVLV
jgi:heptosyltransferase-2